MADRKGSDVGFKITTRGPGIPPGEPPADSQGQAIVLPPTFLPPPGAEYFTVQAELDLAGAGTFQFGGVNPAPPAIAVVPAGFVGVIQTVQFIATLADATLAGFTFSLLLSGQPKVGFTALTIPQLGGTQGIIMSPVAIDAPENNVVGANVVAPNANAHHVACFIQGWYWPIDR